MQALRHILTIAITEIRIEWRSRRVITSMLLLGTLSVLVFAFAGGGSGLDQAIPAFWVSLTLATAAGVAQWAARTAETGVGLALCLGPAAGRRAYVGRLLALGVTLVGVGTLLAAITATLFDILAPARPGALVLTVALGTLGLAAIGGTLLPLLAGRRARLGPLLVLPLAAPVLLLAALASHAAYAPAAAPSSSWVGPLGLAVALVTLVGTAVQPRVGGSEP